MYISGKCHFFIMIVFTLKQQLHYHIYNPHSTKVPFPKGAF